MVEERDESLHEVGSDPAWPESLYFNRAEPDEFPQIGARGTRLAAIQRALRR
jgi:hypothetical protein